MSKNNGLKLLVVDDEPAMRALFRQSLEAAGHEVTEAESGNQALKIIDEQEFDICLTDQVMDGLTGTDLIKIIEQKNKSVGVILITGHADMDSAMEAMRHGALDVIQKPVSMGELIPKIEAFAAKREIKKAGLAKLQKMQEDGYDDPDGPAQHVTQSLEVRPVELPAMEPQGTHQTPQSIEKILDIPVTATVQLGKASLQINELLKLGTGSVLELNKRAGEPVELLVNERLIALGEVVVVNETFGLRVTSIVDPHQRVESRKRNVRLTRNQHR